MGEVVNWLERYGIMKEDLRHQIALTQISQIGDVIIKKLLTRFETATNIFQASKKELECIEGVGTYRASIIRKFNDYKKVDQEISFIEKFNIQPVFYTDALYPKRLHQCEDSPAMLYFKGKADLNAKRIVNIIGTRSPSEYGRHVCTKMVKELAAHGVTVVSGLAYGIDVTAHSAALENDMPTLGVLGHGLDRIYPYDHKEIARKMLNNGGLLTEFMSGTAPDRQNFPRRNRIVAGIADATIVIESGAKGGSMITVDIANSYNRDVLAVPGRVGDPHAAGCLDMIKTNRAMLITGAEDVLQTMGWEPVVKAQPHPQQELFVTLSAEEQQILALFGKREEKHLEDICREAPLPGSQVASLVFKMEMQHMLKGLPGQMYQLY